jgi:hypothetical protein
MTVGLDSSKGVASIAGKGIKVNAERKDVAVLIQLPKLSVQLHATRKHDIAVSDDLCFGSFELLYVWCELCKVGDAIVDQSTTASLTLNAN